MTTIYQYFTDELGAAPADDTLRQLPINSNTSGHPSGSADVRIWRIVLKNPKIAGLRKSRKCSALTISAAARLCRIETRAKDRFCGN
jgi:hypothetical protein